MRARCRKFSVRLRSADGRRECVTELHAETPHAAVGMAESELIGWHAVAYQMAVVIVGRCMRCRDLIEDRQKHHKKAGGRVVCSDCHS